jgi:hypothetical protein
MEMTQDRGWPVRVAQAARALIQLSFAALGIALVLAGIMFLVMWRATGNPDTALTLTALTCGGGFAVIVAVLFITGVGIMSMRHASLANSAGTQKAIETLAVAVARQNDRAEAKDEAMLRMIEIMARGGQLRQPALPAPPTPDEQPKVTTGTTSYVLRVNGREVDHDLQPARRECWMYRLPDGRQARGDVLEAIVEHAWDEYDSAQFDDFRTYLRSLGHSFSNASYRTASDALEREGLMNEHGKLTTGQDEAERIIERMRVSASASAR